LGNLYRDCYVEYAMSLNTFIKFHSKYEERYDFVIQDRLGGYWQNTYKIYDKYYPVIVASNLKCDEMEAAKRSFNREETAYLEKIYEYLCDYSALSTSLI
jgi:hypothetical protein